MQLRNKNLNDSKLVESNIKKSTEAISPKILIAQLMNVYNLFQVILEFLFFLILTNEEILSSVNTG